MNEPLRQLEIRLHGDPRAPTLVYLPGIHGDWTLIPDFRAALAGQVRFVEFSYPRTLTWSLADYAAAVQEALAANQVEEGWVLGESFGSQVVWAMLEREPPAAAGSCFRMDGIILAGGFVRYPWRWAVQSAHGVTRRVPDWWLRSLFRLYALYARQRHRRAPETLTNVQEFIRRRLEPLDRQAIHHRLALIAGNDPRPVAQRTRLPVYSLAGLLDPIVPVPPVRRWLRRYCPGYRGAKTILRADHNVLGTAPGASARQVVAWMGRRGT